MIAFQNPHIRVNVVDKDESRIRRWNSYHLPIYEPGLRDIVRIARDGCRQCVIANGNGHSDSEASSERLSDDSESSTGYGRSNFRNATITVPPREANLFFSTSVQQCIAEADVVLIAVNTPTKMKGRGAGSATDMTAFEAVSREVVLHARNGAIIVEKSTVPCRTAQMIHDMVSRQPLRKENPSLRVSESLALPTQYSFCVLRLWNLGLYQTLSLY
jgi:UDPglucose 6-dehydrogenase